jgi:hypothetical protein
MDWKSKLLLFLFGTFVLCSVTFIIYKQMEISARQEAIEKQVVAQKELADNIMRSVSQYATKHDLESFAKDSNVNLEAIKKDLDSLNANLTAINHVLVSSRNQVVIGSGSSGTTPNPKPKPIDPNNPDPYGYTKNRQVIELSEQFDNTKVPIGNVGFSAWQEKPWDYTIYARQYKLTTVIGTDEDQRHYVYNKFTISSNNKDYDVKIEQSKTLEQYPEAKFRFWNPKLHMNVGGGVQVSTIPPRGDASAGLSLGIMSYGKYRKSPDLSILQLGVGYQFDSQRPYVSVNPINYNVGKLLPGNIANNTYFGPTVQVNTAGNVLLGAGLSVGF